MSGRRSSIRRLVRTVGGVAGRRGFLPACMSAGRAALQAAFDVCSLDGPTSEAPSAALCHVGEASDAATIHSKEKPTLKGHHVREE